MQDIEGSAVGARDGALPAQPGLLFLRVAAVPCRPRPREVGDCHSVLGLSYPPRPEASRHLQAPGSGCQLWLWARRGMKLSSRDERLVGLGWANKPPHPRWEDLWAPV